VSGFVHGRRKRSGVLAVRHDVVRAVHIIPLRRLRDRHLRPGVHVPRADVVACAKRLDKAARDLDRVAHSAALGFGVHAAARNHGRLYGS